MFRSCQRIGKRPAYCGFFYVPCTISLPYSSTSCTDHGPESDIWPSRPNPSPYDILGIRPGEPYNKKRFLQLVKIYHPDRIQPNSSQTTTKPGIANNSVNSDDTKSDTEQAIRLERYRMVVIANDILSHRIKRNAYDRYGVGWVNIPSARERNQYQNANRNSSEPGLYRNTTSWEDWAAFDADAAHDKPSGVQKPIYMSNGAFGLLMAIVVASGCFYQFTRFESAYKDQASLHDENTSEFMHQVTLLRAHTTTTNKPDAKEERIERFRQHQENSKHGYIPVQK